MDIIDTVQVRVLNVSLCYGKLYPNANSISDFSYDVILGVTVTNPELSTALCGLELHKQYRTHCLHDGKACFEVRLPISTVETVQLHDCAITLHGMRVGNVKVEIVPPPCDKLDVLWDDIPRGVIPPFDVVDPKERESYALITFDNCSFFVNVNVEGNKIVLRGLRVTDLDKRPTDPYGCLQLVDKSNLRVIRCFRLYSHHRVEPSALTVNGTVVQKSVNAKNVVNVAEVVRQAVNSVSGSQLRRPVDLWYNGANSEPPSKKAATAAKDVAKP